MSLQSAIEGALPELRRQAESRMTSSVTVRRKSGYDKVNGISTPKWDTIHTDLPFRLGGTERDGQTRTVTIGSTTQQVAARVGSFPACTDDLRDDDLVEITDGDNVGLVLRIVEADWQDQATARRVPVIAEQRPKEWSA